MSVRIHPQAIAPRGIIEGNHYTTGGGVALKAIASWGDCIDFSIVYTREEYDREYARLDDRLDERDPVGDRTQAALRAAARRGVGTGGLRLA